MQFYAPWGKRRQVKSKLELKDMELAAKDEIIGQKDDLISAMKDSATEMDKLRDKRQKLAEKIADEYIEASDKGLIQKVPIKWKGKGWGDALKTLVTSVPDDKIPLLGPEVKGMIEGIVEGNKDSLDEMTPLLLGGLLQFVGENLPDETKKILMRFVSSGTKEKGK